MSPSEGLAMLKNWEIQKSKLSCISKGRPLGPMSTPVVVSIVESNLRIVPLSGSASISVDVSGVEFSSIISPLRITLELKFPGDGSFAFEEKLQG